MRAMQVFHCDDRVVRLPPGHRFPMVKYPALRRALVLDGLFAAGEIASAPAAPIDALLAVHDEAYVHAFLEGTLSAQAITRIGFPWSTALVARCLASVGGTLAATRAALEARAADDSATGLAGAAHGASLARISGLIAGTLAGGTHHAHRDFGAGYCVFNDIAVAARAALDGSLSRFDLRAVPGPAATTAATSAPLPAVRRVLVVDLDVHQGDGTAAIFEGEPAVFTLSLHGARNFPARKQRSSLDVELPDGTGDGEYLAALRPALEESLQRAQPDLIFYQAGVDALAADRLGRLALTHAGLRERDTLVLRAALDLRVPLVLTLGGGYADPIEASVEAHVGTYRAVREVNGI
jgi:acetoin utilization deacetylase AcuC-like enzyme